MTDFSPSPVMLIVLALLLTAPPVVQAPEPILYSQLAPVSIPETVSVPSLVILSPALPVSVANAIVGARALVSNVTVNALLGAVFPAASVCLTVIDCAAASLVNVKLSLLPEVHVVPSVLYSHVAPSSKPNTVIFPLLVTPSVRFVSETNAIVGVAIVVSRLNFKVALLPLAFPATSV